MSSPAPPPPAGFVQGSGLSGLPRPESATEGLSLLDIFALASLAGYRAAGSVSSPSAIATQAYDDAYAMITERNTRA